MRERQTCRLPRKAAASLESFGWRVERIVDVGVAGLHRLLTETNRLRSCGVLIVAAGMEGRAPRRRSRIGEQTCDRIADQRRAMAQASAGLLRFLAC